MKRRMIATDIISEGKFLRMSLTAQGLYLHLLGNADDDGCVDAYTILRMVGAKEDDLVLLKEREYITVLDEHEWILWITGFQDFNWIDARYKEDSKYLPLLRAKVEGLEIVESTKQDYNKRRYQKRKLEKKLSAHVQPMGNPCDALGGTLRVHGIGKERKGKESNTTLYVDETSTEDIEHMKFTWKENAGTTLRNHQEQNLKAYQYLLQEVGAELPNYLKAVRMIRADEYQKRTLQAKLINYIGLKEKLEEVEAYMQAHLDKKQIKATHSRILEAS